MAVLNGYRWIDSDEQIDEMQAKGRNATGVLRFRREMASRPTEQRTKYDETDELRVSPLELA